LTALYHPVTGQHHRGHVVLALSHPQYRYAQALLGQGSNTVRNTLVHELFRCGYNENWLLRSEHTLENGHLQALIDDLQNEGMATYVAYKVHALYPSPLETNYPRLGSKLWVRLPIARLNRLFKAADKMAPDRLWKRVVRFTERQGVSYLVGAYMAKTIDEQLGREALRAAIAKGPVAFIRTYNAVAKKGMRLAFQSVPSPEDSVYLQLREAALAEDTVAVDAQLSTVEGTTVETSPYEAYVLYTTGHLLLHQGKVDRAIRVFQHCIALDQENANGYFGLGECYQAIGENDLARAAFEEGLRLDPRAVRAAIALEGR
jgi:tetratricopeptide (TPR) repeat protein